LGKTLGLLLLLLGLFMIIKSFHPEILHYLIPYSSYIKRSFWGVILVLIGLFMISRNKIWRAIVKIVFVVYLTLYIVLVLNL